MLRPGFLQQLLCDLDEWLSISVDGLIVLMTPGLFQIGREPNGRVSGLLQEAGEPDEELCRHQGNI